MFKVSKLIETKDEIVNINYINNELYKYKEGLKDSYKSLHFEISGNIKNTNYTLTFALNCRNEVLLDFPMNEKINIKDYILHSETFFYVNDKEDMDPDIEIIMMRYLKNNYIVYIKGLADLGIHNGKYASIIEFEFNLDDYLNN